MSNRKNISFWVGIIFSLFGLVQYSEATNLDDKMTGVTVQKVSFPNQSITVVGNLYTPANFDKNKKHAAIVVVHPFGGVKEQTAGLYARKLAEQGFVTLAYDASYQGDEYYRTPRAQHPNSPNRYMFTSLGLQMAFFPFEQIQTISPHPLLMIAGSEADTLYFSKDAYEKAKEPKELFIIPGASHIDLYDKPRYVTPAVAKLKEFFGKALN